MSGEEGTEIDPAIVKAAQQTALDNWDEFEQQAEATRHLYSGGRKENPIRRGDESIPACDACGKEFGGTKRCSKCGCTYYCSRECQVGHWKYGGHKNQCAQMKEDCRTNGEFAVTTLSTTDPSHVYEIENAFEELSGAGAFEAAVEHGLFPALLDAMEYEKNEMDLEQRLEEAPFSRTQSICCTLFRGERVEGRGIKRRGFNCIDGQRVSDFVLSNPSAVEIWWGSVCDTTLKVFDRRAAGDGRMQRVARDCLAAWSLTLANKAAAKAILVLETEEKSIERAKFFCKTGKEVIEACERGYRRADPNQTLQGLMCQCLAMIELRYKEFKICQNKKKLNMRKLAGTNKGAIGHSFDALAIPLGRGTIAKGKNLPMDEARAIMMNAMR